MGKDKEKKLHRREVGLRAASLKVREAGEGTPRIVTGRAILFNTPSEVLWHTWEGAEVREVIAPGAITRELLDGCDIKLTLYHDNQRLLARSKNGSGTLSYEVDAEGVTFSAEMPDTADGDAAYELVSRGDIDGCSFAFSTYYGDTDYVRESHDDDGNVIYTVEKVTGVYDMTLTPDPAYAETSAEVRSLQEVMEREPAEDSPDTAQIRAQIKEMRVIANKKFY